MLLAQLARLVARRPVERPLALRLAEAAQLMLGADGASITVESATPNRLTLAITDPIALRLEELQDVLGEGPSWDAYATGSPQTTDLSEALDVRWPQFGPAAREAVGPRTVHGLPMRPDDQVLGALAVHLLAPGALRGGLPAALFLADTVGAALLMDPAGHGSQAADAGPWSGRSHIHQATGMVIAQLRVPAADALAILRAHAYAANTTLDDIAGQVLNRSLDLGRDDR